MNPACLRRPELMSQTPCRAAPFSPFLPFGLQWRHRGRLLSWMLSLPGADRSLARPVRSDRWRQQTVQNSSRCRRKLENACHRNSGAWAVEISVAKMSRVERGIVHASPPTDQNQASIPNARCLKASCFRSRSMRIPDIIIHPVPRPCTPHLQHARDHLLRDRAEHCLLRG